MDKGDEILQVLKQILEILQRQEERAQFVDGFEERMAQRQREVFEAMLKFDPLREGKLSSNAPPSAGIGTGQKTKGK